MSKRDTIEVPLDLVEAEKKIVEEALRRADGCVVEAANLLRVDRGKIYRKAAKYGLARQGRRGAATSG